MYNDDDDDIDDEDYFDIDANIESIIEEIEEIFCYPYYSDNISIYNEIKKKIEDIVSILKKYDYDLKDDEDSYKILNVIDYEKLSLNETKEIIKIISPYIIFNFFCKDDVKKNTIFNLLSEKIDQELDELEDESKKQKKKDVLNIFIENIDIHDLFTINYKYPDLIEYFLNNTLIIAPISFINKLYEYVKELINIIKSSSLIQDSLLLSIVCISFHYDTIRNNFISILKKIQKIKSTTKSTNIIINRINFLHFIINTWKITLSYFCCDQTIVFRDFFYKYYDVIINENSFTTKEFFDLTIFKDSTEYSNMLYQNTINVMGLIIKKNKKFTPDEYTTLINLYLLFTDLVVDKSISKNLVDKIILNKKKSDDRDIIIKEKLLIPTITIFIRNDNMTLFYLKHIIQIVNNHIKNEHSRKEKIYVIEYILFFFRKLLDSGSSYKKTFDILKYKDEINLLIKDLDNNLKILNERATYKSDIAAEDLRQKEKNKKIIPSVVVSSKKKKSTKSSKTKPPGVEEIEAEKKAKEEEELKKFDLEIEAAIKANKEKELEKFDLEIKAAIKAEEEELKKTISETMSLGNINNLLKQEIITFFDTTDIIKNIRLFFFKEEYNVDSIYFFDYMDYLKYRDKCPTMMDVVYITELIIFNFIKEYLVCILSVVTSEERLNRLHEMGVKGIGSLTLCGGSSVQYYSNRKLKTNDLDYKFIPKEKCELSEQTQFLKDFILPYFSVDIINVENIIRNRASDIQKTIPSEELKIMFTDVFIQLKKCSGFTFNYHEIRNIVKVNLVLDSKINVHLLDITFLDSTEVIPKVSVDIIPITIDIIQREYLELQLKLYIEDCNSLKKIYQNIFKKELNLSKKLNKDEKIKLSEKFTAKNITSSPPFTLPESVIHVGCKKAVKQLDAIENPDFIDDTIIRQLMIEYHIVDVLALKKFFKEKFKYNLIADEICLKNIKSSIKGDSGFKKIKKSRSKKNIYCKSRSKMITRKNQKSKKRSCKLSLRRISKYF